MPALVAAMILVASSAAMASDTGGHKAGGEVNIKLPDLTNGANVGEHIAPVKVEFLGGYSGHTLLLGGLVVTIGSKRIDSSIRTRLNSLAQAMKG